jgi:hypothetical protein
MSDTDPFAGPPRSDASPVDEPTVEPVVPTEDAPIDNGGETESQGDEAQDSDGVTSPDLADDAPISLDDEPANV